MVYDIFDDPNNGQLKNSRQKIPGLFLSPVKLKNTIGVGVSSVSLKNIHNKNYHTFFILRLLKIVIEKIVSI